MGALRLLLLSCCWLGLLRSRFYWLSLLHSGLLFLLLGSQFQAVQSRVVILGQVHFQATSLNGLVDHAGFELNRLGNRFMYANGSQWQIGFITRLSLPPLSAITPIPFNF